MPELEHFVAIVHIAVEDRRAAENGDRFFLTLKNRSYRSEHEVPVDVAKRYYRKLREER